MRRAVRIQLDERESRQLRAWTSSPEGARGKRPLRARIVLRAADGWTNQAIARDLGIHPETAALWRRRFAANRLEGIRMDAPRSGARRRARRLWDQIAHAAVHEPTKSGREWTTRSLAKHFHVSHMTVHRVWHARAALPPAGPEITFGPAGVMAMDPVEVDGVFLHPPRRAAILQFDAHRPNGVDGTRSALPTPGPPAAHPRPSLNALYRKWKRLAPRQHPSVGSVADLLVLLRRIEDRSPSVSTFTIVFEGFSRTAERRLRRWVRSHSRFRATKVRTGSSWFRTVERAVGERGPFPEVVPPAAPLGPLAESLASYLRKDPAAPTPFVWMSPAIAWEPSGPSPATSSA